MPILTTRRSLWLPGIAVLGAEAVFACPPGLRISTDCKRLEVDEAENKVLLLMMDLLAQDFSYSAIVSDLNEKGYRTRAGKPWSRVAVFNMMPRLIEVGPRIFNSQEWEQRRLRIARRTAPEP